MINDLFSLDRPGLLVSVRNPDEARIAVDGGADVVDVKEPLRGSLGAAKFETVAEVVAVVAGRLPVSAALGELLDRNELAPFAAGVAFAKCGLAGCGPVADWQTEWQTAMRKWPAGVAPVAVVYADWQLAAAPPPAEVFAAALTARCPALLVDTWDKSAGKLFDHWSPQHVTQFCARVRARGMAVVLAGSLQGDALNAAMDCGANLIAVRGAVCDGGRNGAISVQRMYAVREAMQFAAANR